MLTNKDIFFGMLHIANPNGEIDAELDRYIAMLEPVWLNNTLGVAFAKLFADELAVAQPAERWAKLRDGNTYTDAEGTTRNWDGFLKESSPIAMFIWCKYTEQNYSYVGGNGARADNGARAAWSLYRRKYEAIWWDMVEHTGHINRQGCLDAGNSNSLYNYLLQAKTESGELIYPEFDIKAISPYGRLGL